MRLVELFDKISKWKWLDPRPMRDAIGAEFMAGENIYQVQFDAEFLTKYDLPIEFEEDNPKIVDVMFTMRDARKTLGKQGISITGTGHAFEIFATVKAIMAEYASNREIDYFHFEASEPSRRKLYDRFITNFPGRVEEFIEDTDKHYLVKV